MIALSKYYEVIERQFYSLDEDIPSFSLDLQEKILKDMMKLTKGNLDPEMVRDDIRRVYFNLYG